MTAIWSVDTEAFYSNAKKVKINNPLWLLLNNAYHYGLEFAVKQFLRAGINTFSTTSLKEAVRVRELAPDATVFLMNAVYDFDTVRDYHIHMTLPSLNYYYEHKADLRDIHVHLEFENLLHRSGFKTLEEIQQVLQDHQQNKILNA